MKGENKKMAGMLDTVHTYTHTRSNLIKIVGNDACIVLNKDAYKYKNDR